MRSEQISTELVATLVDNLTRTVQRIDVHVRQSRSGVTEIQIGSASDLAVMGIDVHILETQRWTFRRDHDARGTL